MNFKYALQQCKAFFCRIISWIAKNVVILHQNLIDMRLLTSLLALLFFLPISARNRVSVSLHNGSIIKGQLVELIPDSIVKIEAKDGSLFCFSMKEVLHIEQYKSGQEKVQCGFLAENPHLKKSYFYVKAGLNFCGIARPDAIDMSEYGLVHKTIPGYDFMFGYKHKIRNTNFYYGGEIGFSTRGERMKPFEVTSEDEILTAIAEPKSRYYNIKVAPVVGCNYFINKKFGFCVDMGPFFSYDLAGKDWGSGDSNFFDDITTDVIHISDYNGRNPELTLVPFHRFDLGIQTGIAIIYDRFSIGFSYRRGFVDIKGDFSEDAHLPNESDLEFWDRIYTNYDSVKKDFSFRNRAYNYIVSFGVSF